MTTDDLRADPDIDRHVVGDIVTCLSQVPPQSFFLYAGAGAGKTQTLVSVLEQLREKHGRALRLRSQQIAVITYTNAACDEIVQRLRHDPMFDVRTIHSFVWTLIQGFNGDIRRWLKGHLEVEIAQLLEEQKKGRAGTKAAVERVRSLAAKSERLKLLDRIRVFSYSPQGDNRDRDALNHAEVIGLTASFLDAKPLMRQLLVSRYPLLLIDESQDTNKHLVDALMAVQREHAPRFAVGLIGDTMQRIYNEGRADLASAIPSNWATPRMRMNHRSPERIVRLINRIRADVDTESQKCRADAGTGTARLFVCQSNGADPERIEASVRERMAILTSDPQWRVLAQVKTLLLEHHMAARRMKFETLFDPLYRSEAFRTGLLNGDLPLLRFFTETVAPLVIAGLEKNPFRTAALLRNDSSILSDETLRAAGGDQLKCLAIAKTAVHDLLQLWNEDSEPTLEKILSCVQITGLFQIPAQLLPFANPIEVSETGDAESTDESPGTATDQLMAVRACLQAPFSQVRAYHDYVTEVASFDTHQGVKGRQFDRVMVVINDAEARGFMFSYSSLFGTKAASTSSRSRTQEARESSEDRTRRLFYVTCSRSKESLAIVAYSDNPEAVKLHAVSKQWFDASEIEVIH